MKSITLLLITAIPALTLAQTINLYVSPNGNDNWSGSLPSANADKTDGPLATVTGARDAIRKYREPIYLGMPVTRKLEPIHVKIAPGRYELAEPVVFEPNDSGYEGYPVVYEALSDEKPVVTGGRLISGFRKGEDGVWQTEIPDVREGRWYFNQLFINGRRAIRARTPNEGYYRIDDFMPGIKNPAAEQNNPESKIGFKYKEGDIKRWDNLDDINIFIYHSWTSSLHWIDKLDDPNHIVRFTAQSHWPIGYWEPGEKKPRYYVENYFEALDSPGEWYLNRKTGVLYYKPRESEKIDTAVFEAPVLRKLVEFKGDYVNERFVEHIQFKGLSFGCADWFVADKGVADGQAACWLEAVIFAQGAHNCVIEDCEVSHVGEYGVYFERGCSENLIKDCKISDLGAGGVRFGFMAKSQDANEATEYNVVTNCVIRDGGHVFPAGVGVWIGRSSYSTISHNEICDFYYTGVSIGWSWGYAESSAHHNILEYNHIHDLGKGVLSDMGGVYTLGISPGTVIRNNIFHDIQSYSYGGWGLYTDEGSTGIVLENNIVYNTKTGGFHQHYGKENIVRNNILAYSSQGQVQRSREEEHISFTFERNIVYFDKGTLLSGTWKNGNYVMDNNIYWNATDPNITFANMSFEEWKAKGFDKNSIIADPKFIDAKKYDFRLKEDSPAIKLGFVPIDISMVGPKEEPVVCLRCPLRCWIWWPAVALVAVLAGGIFVMNRSRRRPEA